MKAVILAGGLGSRLSEETTSRPKPMVEIGGRPIIWHIMKMYTRHGVTDFIICCGYKGYMIKEYFANYFLHMSDVSINMRDNKIEYHDKRAEPWSVTLIDTGEASMTGGRLRRIARYVENEGCFCMTYGDGLSDVDISATIEFHKQHGKKATLMGTYPPGRFGALNMKGAQVSSFEEKPKGDGSIINGGFFVLSPTVIDYIAGDDTTWEQEPMARLASDGNLMVFEHHGFWQPMDTLRDKMMLERLWQANEAPWKQW